MTEQAEITAPKAAKKSKGAPDQAVKRNLEEYMKLKEMLEADNIDAQTILDTCEGETNLHEALLQIADSALDDEAMAEAVGARIAAMQERKSRLEKTAENKRTMIIMAMEKAGLQIVKGPEATISVRATKGKVIVTDESLIPSAFFKAPEPVLDRAALKVALEAGDMIEGAAISNGGVSLSIRVK